MDDAGARSLDAPYWSVKKPRTPPTMEDICTGEACQQCDGRGYVFRNVLWACKSCLGLGQKLAPKADPSKVLQ